VFIVSAVDLKQATNGDTALHVQISKAPGLKCERCWNYSARVGEDKKYPTVCERCSAFLKEIDPAA
jgi:isoleucyl-tRNA synthetase